MTLPSAAPAHHFTSGTKGPDKELKQFFIRLALAFREEFADQFIHAMKNPTAPGFSMTVERFDQFAVDHGFATARAADTIDPVVHTGLVHQRNKFRTLINSSGGRGLHGSPRFRINVHSHGKALRVDLLETHNRIDPDGHMMWPSTSAVMIDAAASVCRIAADVQFLLDVVRNTPSGGAGVMMAQQAEADISKYINTTAAVGALFKVLREMEDFVAAKTLQVARTLKPKKATP